MKNIKIEIPEGYKIDLIKSDLSKGEIILKPIQKRWNEFKYGEYFYIYNFNRLCKSKGEIGLISDWIYPTEELIIAAEAIRKLSFWRNEVWKSDNNWYPDWECRNTIKYVICIVSNNVEIRQARSYSRPLAFSTFEIANKFIRDHSDLIELAKPYL